MKNLRRRTTRALLVPFALFVLVLGAAMPAAAYDDSAPAVAPTPAPAPTYFIIAPLSLKW